jgi:hypothetical protein
MFASDFVEVLKIWKNVTAEVLVNRTMHQGGSRDDGS